MDTHMLKGTQKRMVVLRTADSTLFEAAYFVLRDTEKADTQSSVLEEANRILEKSFTPQNAKQTRRAARARRRRAALLFLLGMICGMALCVLAALLLR
jgi:hypothetical protein